MATEASYPFVDLDLARRIEHTEAASNAALVEARARLEPGVGAVWERIAGAVALFDGPASFLTQSFGLGMTGPVDAAGMERLEAFFTSRGARPAHEVSPLADASVLPMMGERGYRAVELSSVLFRPAAQGMDLPERVGSAVRVRRVEAEESERWADVAAAGWGSESPAVGAFMRALGRVLTDARGSHCFLAEVEGEPIAAGSLQIADGVALLAGASTIPAHRGRGGQSALIAARVGFAGEQGCDLVVFAAAPGSGSQRNAERFGFRVAYTRTKWRKVADPG
jgi:GNAT superfamily N-acetyltransferase